MSKFKPGTLVMIFGVPEGQLVPQLHNGMCGEVKDFSKFSNELLIEDVAVEFPDTPALNTTTGYWKMPCKWLVPLSGPDIDVGDNTDLDTKIDEYFEEHA